MKAVVVAVSLLLITLVAACASPGPKPTTVTSPISPIPTVKATVKATVEDPVSAPIARLTPAPDKAALAGKIVVSGATQMPLGNTVVRLANVYWNSDKSDGAVVLNGATSPGATTNEAGEFFFSNIDPGDYAVIVGDVEAKSLAVTKPDGSARVFVAVPGQILDAGTLEVPHIP
jgi:hypothetical protein